MIAFLMTSLSLFTFGQNIKLEASRTLNGQQETIIIFQKNNRTYLSTNCNFLNKEALELGLYSTQNALIHKTLTSVVRSQKKERTQKKRAPHQWVIKINDTQIDSSNARFSQLLTLLKNINLNQWEKETLFSLKISGTKIELFQNKKKIESGSFFENCNFQRDGLTLCKIENKIFYILSKK